MDGRERRDARAFTFLRERYTRGCATIGNVCAKRVPRGVLDHEIEALPCRPASSPGLDPAISFGKVTGQGRRISARRRGGGMAGFIWYTNHRMWRIVPPFADSREVLKAYIVDPSAYVYWSTPRFQDEIKAGTIAYIFRTADDDGNDGIVARGRRGEIARP